jgi:CBS domain-containing protein
MEVQEIMVRDVVTVGPETPLKEVAATLLSRGISGVPVVDENRTVLGVVSETDILQKELGAAARSRGLGQLVHRAGGRLEAKVRARTAREAMTAPALAVRPTAPARTAATLMVDRHVSRLVVVDHQQVPGPAEGGPLVGIVTRADLVRAFARSDDAVAQEIDEAMRRDVGIPPGCVTVDVRDGEVVLDGHIDDRSTLEALVSSVAAVPGVVTVVSNVSSRSEEGAKALDGALDWRLPTDTRA